MMTPFSQLVGVTAVMNIVTGRRWSIIVDEVIQYALGYYGQPVAPIEPDVLDRIAAAPRYREIAARPPENPDLEQIRREHGGVDDDELLLRALVPASDIAAMRAAGPVRRAFPMLSSPELDFAAELMRLTQARSFRIALGQFDLTLER
jgi:oxaloacetate decarboxylase alpha subunit